MIETLIDAFRGRKKSLQTVPGLTLRAVWNDFDTPPTRRAGKYHRLFQQHIRSFDAESRASILNDLLTIEQCSQQANDTLGFIRAKIMDLTDQKLRAEHLDLLQQRLESRAAGAGHPPPPNEPLFRTAAVCSIQIAVLRRFCIRKYGDGGARGWFAGYQQVSRFFHQHMFESPRGSAAPLELTFEGRPVRPNQEDFQQLRSLLQRAYVGQRFRLEIKGEAPQRTLPLVTALPQTR